MSPPESHLFLHERNYIDFLADRGRFQRSYSPREDMSTQGTCTIFWLSIVAIVFWRSVVFCLLVGLWRVRGAVSHIGPTPGCAQWQEKVWQTFHETPGNHGTFTGRWYYAATRHKGKHRIRSMPRRMQVRQAACWQGDGALLPVLFVDPRWLHRREGGVRPGCMVLFPVPTDALSHLPDADRSQQPDDPGADTDIIRCLPSGRPPKTVQTAGWQGRDL